MVKEEVDVHYGVFIDSPDISNEVSEGFDLDFWNGKFDDTEGEHSVSDDIAKFKDDDISPKVGMVFDTVKKAYDYYNEYARTKGFSVRKRRTNKKRGDPSRVVLQTLCCSCEGQYKNVNTSKRKREDKRFGCLAEFQIKINQEEKHVLAKFVAEHTHELDPPSIKRWTKSAKDEDVFSSDGKAILSDEDPLYKARYCELTEIAQQIVAMGVQSEELFLFAREKLLRLKEELEEFDSGEGRYLGL